VLKALDSSEFVETSESFPQPYLDFPDLDPTESAPFELPAILVPPEVIELDGLATDAGEDAQVKKEDWPQYFPHLFDSTVCLPMIFPQDLHIDMHDFRSPLTLRHPLDS